MPTETHHDLKKFFKLYDRIDNKIIKDQDGRIEKLYDDPLHRDYMIPIMDGEINRQNLPHLKLSSKHAKSPIPPKSAFNFLNSPIENTTPRKKGPKNHMIELIYGNDRQFINPYIDTLVVPIRQNSTNIKKRNGTSNPKNKKDVKSNTINWSSIKVQNLAISLNESKSADISIKNQTMKSHFFSKNLDEYLLPLEEIDPKYNNNSSRYPAFFKSKDDSKDNNNTNDPEKIDIPINNYLLNVEPFTFLSSKNNSIECDDFLKSRDNKKIKDPTMKGIKNFTKNLAVFTNSSDKKRGNSISNKELSKFSSTNLSSTKNKSPLNTVYIEDERNNILPDPQDTIYSLPFAENIISNSFHRPQALIRPQVMQGDEINKISIPSPLRKNPQPYNTSKNFFKRYEYNRQAAKLYKDQDSQKNIPHTTSNETPRISINNQIFFSVKNTIPFPLK